MNSMGALGISDHREHSIASVRQGNQAGTEFSIIPEVGSDRHPIPKYLHILSRGVENTPLLGGGFGGSAEIGAIDRMGDRHC